MKVVDLNILLYAVNSDAPHHRQARVWWERALSEEEQVGLAWIVILGFLRLATRTNLFPRPLPPKRAMGVVDEWIGHSTVVMLEPRERHWSILRDLLTESGTLGNLTTDAHLAALAVEYGATLYSSDNDFSRFGAALKFVNPLL